MGFEGLSISPHKNAGMLCTVYLVGSASPGLNLYSRV